MAVQFCKWFAIGIIKWREDNMYRIMIIEDDITIAKAMKEYLSRWDYHVIYLSDFKDIIDQVIHFGPQLILLDIMLPYYNGFYWCSEIRKISKVPIIFISSANDNMNIVMAMNMGGDDFISKPFDLDVLIAKIRALLRRTYSFQGQINYLEHNGVLLNLSDTTLSFKDKKIEMTKNEYRIMQVLMENVGGIVLRDEIMEKLWENDDYVDDNTLTVNINRLRKKLNEIGLYDFIKTKKGLGYMVE